MKRNLSVAIALASLVPAAALADVTVYGKANVALQHANIQDEGSDDSYLELTSNASRIGFKGSEKLSDGLSAIYQFEYEAFVDDGDTFSQRNIYVGLKGNFGQFIAGNFDSPLKSAQGKVDLFGDLAGDIKHVVTKNDKRIENIVMYSTPSSSPFGGNIAYATREEDGADPKISASFTFSNDTIYAALAADQDVVDEGTDALRAVVQGKFGIVTLGALYEQLDDGYGDSKDGFLVSASFKAGEKTKINAQYGSSDQQAEGGETISVGAEFKYTKNLKSFVYYTTNSSDKVSVNGGDFTGEDVSLIDSDYLGLGLELKF